MNRVMRQWLTRHFGKFFPALTVPYPLAKRLYGARPIRLIDIGAHQGAFTRAIDRLCGVSQGILVEAQPSRAAELLVTFPSQRFEVAAVALSNMTGELSLEINEFDATTSILKIKRELSELGGVNVNLRQTVRCPVATLDSLAETKLRDVIDLIKLDVQGAELLVIKGGETTLRRTRMLWTELSFVPLYEGACLFHEVHSHLRQLGFRFLEIEPGFRSPSGELLQADALFANDCVAN